MGALIIAELFMRELMDPNRDIVLWCFQCFVFLSDVKDSTLLQTL